MAKMPILKKDFKNFELGIIELLDIVPQMKEELGWGFGNYVQGEVILALLKAAFWGKPGCKKGNIIKCRYGNLTYTSKEGLVIKFSFYTPGQELTTPDSYEFLILLKNNYPNIEEIQGVLAKRGWKSAGDLFTDQ